MTSIEDLKNAVEAVIDTSEQPSDVLFGLNVCLPVKTLSQSIGVDAVKTLAGSAIVWTSPVYQRPLKHFFVFFEFEEICRCLKVTIDSVSFDFLPRFQA